MTWLSYFILALNLVAISGALFVIVRLRLKRRRKDRQSSQDREEGGQ